MMDLRIMQAIETIRHETSVMAHEIRESLIAFGNNYAHINSSIYVSNFYNFTNSIKSLFSLGVCMYAFYRL